MCDEAMKGDLRSGPKNGLVLDVGGYHKNVITLAPSLLITHNRPRAHLVDQLHARRDSMQLLLLHLDDALELQPDSCAPA
jgi:hypothetical protein